MNQPVDTVITAETPEGIAIALRPAGLAVRSAAYLIDAAARFGILSTVAVALQAAGRMGTGLMLIVLFVLNWLYPVIFELLPGAASPGKRAMGLQVMMSNGLPITPAGCLTRNLLRVVDFMPALYGFGIVAMLLRRDFCRLGDLAGGTLVVYRNQPEPAGAIGAGDPAPPAVALSMRQQAAITAFAWRQRRLTPARAEEIAALAASAVLPESAGAAEPPAVAPRLLAIARWLHGERRAADAGMPT